MATKHTQDVKSDKLSESGVAISRRGGKSKSTPHMSTHQLSERWFVVDVSDKILGRAATVIAKFLMGKDEASFNPAVAAKTNVIVINADKIKLSGKKLTDKLYYRHSGYLGSVRSTTPAKILEGSRPETIIEKAVYGMLPKNKLRHVMMGRLRIFVGDAHPHAGQNPVTISL